LQVVLCRLNDFIEFVISIFSGKIVEEDKERLVSTPKGDHDGNSSAYSSADESKGSSESTCGHYRLHVQVNATFISRCMGVERGPCNLDVRMFAVDRKCGVNTASSGDAGSLVIEHEAAASDACSLVYGFRKRGNRAHAGGPRIFITAGNALVQLHEVYIGFHDAADPYTEQMI
jgi:hypothetical protein